METQLTIDKKQDPSDSRKEILDFLKDLQNHYGTYHNHKENVGWAGVALFTGLMAAIPTTLRQQPLEANLFFTRAGLSIVVIGTFLVFWFYVNKQFALRSRAADLVAACIRLRSQIVGEPSRLLVPDDWAPPTKSSDGDMQSSHVLPRAIIEAAKELSLSGQTSRILLEGCAYAIMLGLAIALLVAIWTTM